jgi:tRNA threonylcarbamoyl adenosine modification protein YjeE
MTQDPFEYLESQEENGQSPVQCGQSSSHGSSRYILRDTDALIAFGASLARALPHPRVVALSGDLGAGKTTMAKGMIAALTGALTSEVISPTFQYVQFYTRGELLVAHFDVWRLRGVDEFVELGLEEYLSNTMAIIEWPDRISGLLPKNTLWINISIIENGRLVTINPEISFNTVRT